MGSVSPTASVLARSTFRASLSNRQNKYCLFQIPVEMSVAVILLRVMAIAVLGVA